MSAWRRKALALFPEKRADWQSPDESLHELFFDLAVGAPAHHAAWDRDPDDAVAANFLRRLYGFAEWCLHEPALWDDAAIGFLEHIVGAVHFDALVPWLSPAMREAVEQTWALGSAQERLPAWRRAVEGCTQEPWRTTVYQAGTVQAL